MNRKDLAAYFREARSFDDDRVAQKTRSERRAWRVAGLLLVALLLVSGAAVAIASMKTLVPIVIEVDRSNGNVEVMTTFNGLKGVEPREIEQKYWLWQYVSARESYVWEDVKANADRVSLMSDTVEQNKYARLVSADNPQSPQRVYGRKGIVDARIRSIALGRDGSSATVRFTRRIRPVDGAEEEKGFVATVTYSFVDVNLTEAERMINPRGFMVRLYRIDEELTK